ncbi:MAG: glycosyltransferase family 4 protein [Candidatus ainarchaeum sp.]|nr:glycosyltransferase family 4 protein [Candidatus ainarchaeum sp.]
MKILFIVQEGNDSGITTYAKLIEKELIKNGVDVNTDNNYFDKYDIIHIHGRPNFGIVIAKLINNPKIVTTTHMTLNELNGLMPNSTMFVAQKYIDFLYTHSKKIFVVSQSLFNQFKKNNEIKNKIVFLPYSIDVGRFYERKEIDVKKFKEKYDIDKNKKTILCVASIQERKGIYEFIEIAKQLKEYNFVWVGKIPDTIYLKNRDVIKKLVENKPKNVTFTGTLYGDDLVNAYYASDLFWLPSKSETFGLVNIEAAACGLNVLLPNLEVFKQFQDFAIFYETTPKEKIKDILENKKNKSKYKKLINIGKKESMKYDIKKNIKRLIKEYKEVIR